MSNITHRPLLEQPPLLNLPGELRNQIYEYVLTADNEIILMQSATYGVEERQPRIKSYFTDCCNDGIFDTTLSKEFNKLKYVCRQLWTETACLELKFNPILVYSTAKLCLELRPPATVFANFLLQCTPSKTSWITDVTLDPGDQERLRYFHSLDTSQYGMLTESSVHFETIAIFCHSNPHATVKYLVPNFLICEFHYMPYQFLHRGQHLMAQLRHKDLWGLTDRPDIFRERSKYLGEWASAEQVQALQVPNLRFYPKGEQISPLFSMKDYYRPTLRCPTSQSVDECIALMKDWIKNGL